MKILVGVDLTAATEVVLKQAEQLALKLEAEVWLLHIGEPEPDFVGYEIGPQGERDYIAKKFHQEHRQLQALAENLRCAGIATTALLVQGATEEMLLTEAEKLGVDMIVLGSHGRGAVRQLMLGSTSAGVLHRAKCPVLVVPTRSRI